MIPDRTYRTPFNPRAFDSMMRFQPCSQQEILIEKSNRFVKLLNPSPQEFQRVCSTLLLATFDSVMRLQPQLWKEILDKRTMLSKTLSSSLIQQRQQLTAVQDRLASKTTNTFSKTSDLLCDFMQQCTSQVSSHHAPTPPQQPKQEDAQIEEAAQALQQLSIQEKTEDKKANKKNPLEDVVGVTEDDFFASAQLRKVNGNLHSLSRQERKYLKGIAESVNVLVLYDLKLSEKQIQSIARLFPDITHFRCKSLNDNGIKQLALFKKLTHLNISDCKGNPITEKGFQHITHLPLRQVTISHCRQIAPLLLKCKSIRIAELGDPTITDDERQKILNQHPTLQFLGPPEESP
jgi:hypothetical protein